jgi:N-methylhydantoinase B
MASAPGRDGIVTAEVVGNYLLSVAEQVNQTMIKASFSPNIKERQDCSAALLDGRGRLVAQADNNPAHLGSLVFMGEEVLKKYGSQIRDRDVFIHNDPYTRGSSHLSDVTMVTPIFAEGQLAFFAVNTGHHVDVGGRVPGSTAPDCRTIYEEGIRIPLIRLVDSGVLNEEMLELICHACRDPEERSADLRAQIAANEIARRPLTALAKRYGIEGLWAIVDEILDYAERRGREVIARLPEGRYPATVWMDSDGINAAEIPITVTSVIRDRSIHFDFTGTGAQAAGAMNCVESIVLAAVYFAFKAMLDPGIPPNSGFFRCLSVYAPPGTIVNPSPPAAVGVRVDTAQKITDAVIRSLGAALPPSRAVAGAHAVNSAWIFYGDDPIRKKPYVYLETFGGGAGAVAGKDGLDGIHVYLVNVRNLPIEVLEREYPLLVERYAFVPDSGGAGEFRGGLGIRRDIRVLSDGTYITPRSEGQKRETWGVLGGGGGAPARLFRNPGTARETRLPGKGSRIPLRRGDVLSLRSPGGGGLGDARRRDPTRIAADLANGKITPEHAWKVYRYGTRRPARRRG